MTVLAGSEMEPRWRMQETLREFAEEKLTLSGRADEARRALPTLFRRSGTRTTFHSTSIEKSEMDQLAKEYDNTHSALNWALETEEEVEHALSCVAILSRFW